MPDEFADGGLTATDQTEVGRRFGQPESQQTCARRRLSPVDRLQQRTFARTAGSSEEFEVTGGRGVEEHGISELGLDEAEQVLRTVAERVGDVAKDRAGRAEGRMLVGQAEACQAMDGKRLRHESRAGRAIEIPTWETGYRPAL